MAHRLLIAAFLFAAVSGCGDGCSGANEETNDNDFAEAPEVSSACPEGPARVRVSAEVVIVAWGSFATPDGDFWIAGWSDTQPEMGVVARLAAGTDEWAVVEQFEGGVLARSVAVSGDTIVVHAEVQDPYERFVVASFDGGATWSQRTEVTGLYQVATDGSTLYAAYLSGNPREPDKMGIRTSTDGKMWTDEELPDTDALFFGRDGNVYRRDADGFDRRRAVEEWEQVDARFGEATNFSAFSTDAGELLVYRVDDRTLRIREPGNLRWVEETFGSGAGKIESFEYLDGELYMLSSESPLTLRQRTSAGEWSVVAEAEVDVSYREIDTFWIDAQGTFRAIAFDRNIFHPLSYVLTRDNVEDPDFSVRSDPTEAVVDDAPVRPAGLVEVSDGWLSFWITRKPEMEDPNREPLPRRIQAFHSMDGCEWSPRASIDNVRIEKGVLRAGRTLERDRLPILVTDELIVVAGWDPDSGPVIHRSSDDAQTFETSVVNTLPDEEPLPVTAITELPDGKIQVSYQTNETYRSDDDVSAWNRVDGFSMKRPGLPYMDYLLRGGPNSDETIFRIYASRDAERRSWEFTGADFTRSEEGEDSWFGVSGNLYRLGDSWWVIEFADGVGRVWTTDDPLQPDWSEVDAANGYFPLVATRFGDETVVLGDDHLEPEGAPERVLGRIVRAGSSESFEYQPLAGTQLVPHFASSSAEGVIVTFQDEDGSSGFIDKIEVAP